MKPRGDRTLQAVDEHYRRVVETSPDGIILTDLDGTILIANTAAASLYGGRSGGELLGTPLLDLVAEQDREHMREITEEVLHRGWVRNAECRLLRGNDSFFADFAISVVTDEDGEPTGFVNTIRDITTQKRREQELKNQTLHDPLTGLPNRVLFHDRLGQAIERARRVQTQVGVLYIDLDDFKGVNDRFGHDYADTVLQQTAQRMQGTVRASDTLSRIGGDEFAVVLPLADAAGAAIIAEKLEYALTSPFQVAGNLVHVGASIGMAVYPTHGDDAMTVLRRADMAMYAVKRGGRSDFGQLERNDRSEWSRRSPRASAVSAVQVDPRVLTLARTRADSSTSH